MEFDNELFRKCIEMAQKEYNSYMELDKQTEFSQIVKKMYEQFHNGKNHQFDYNVDLVDDWSETDLETMLKKNFESKLVWLFAVRNYFERLGFETLFVSRIRDTFNNYERWAFGILIKTDGTYSVAVY